MKTFLYSYDFQGARWDLPVLAKTKEEAEYRLLAIQRAQYDGEVLASMSFDGPPQSPLLWFLAGLATYACAHIIIELWVWIW